MLHDDQRSLASILLIFTQEGRQIMHFYGQWCASLCTFIVGKLRSATH